MQQIITQPNPLVHPHKDFAEEKSLPKTASMSALPNRPNYNTRNTQKFADLNMTIDPNVMQKEYFSVTYCFIIILGGR